MHAYAKSKTPAGDGDKRQTPKAVFDRIQELIGIPIIHDICAESHTTKCQSFWDESEDAFTFDWFRNIRDIPSWLGTDYINNSAWMNPPYSNITPWVASAFTASKAGCIIVGCVPDDRSVSWYQDWVEDKAAIIYVPDKRISFEDGNGVPQKGNPKGSVFPVWMPMYVDKSNYVRFKL